MILRRLAEHYDRIVAEGSEELPPPGYSSQKISFCIVLNPNGSLNQFESLLEQDGQSQARKVGDCAVVRASASGQGPNPCLLWDNAEYLLGYTTDPERTERAVREFEASRAMHLALQDTISHPSFTAVCAFFSNWSPDQAAQHPENARRSISNFGVFPASPGETQFARISKSRLQSLRCARRAKTQRGPCAWFPGKWKSPRAFMSRRSKEFLAHSPQVRSWCHSTRAHLLPMARSRASTRP